MGILGFKKVDSLGRITIPFEFRKRFCISNGGFVEAHLKDNCLIIKPLEKKCTFCGNENDLKPFKDKYICKDCIDTIS